MDSTMTTTTTTTKTSTSETTNGLKPQQRQGQESDPTMALDDACFTFFTDQNLSAGGVVSHVSTSEEFQLSKNSKESTRHENSTLPRQLFNQPTTTTATDSSTPQQQQQQQQKPSPLALPLSMRWMKLAAGGCLGCCGSCEKTKSTIEDEAVNFWLNYDLAALQTSSSSCALTDDATDNSKSNGIPMPSTTAVSPFVLAPMTMSLMAKIPKDGLDDSEHFNPLPDVAMRQDSPENLAPTPAFSSTEKHTNNNTTFLKEMKALSPNSLERDAIFQAVNQPSPASLHQNSALATSAWVEKILGDYMTACQFYGCQRNAGVLTTFRFFLPCLRMTGNFADVDILALAEVLLKYSSGPLSFITRLDFSIPRGRKQLDETGMQSHGALALAKVLQKSQSIQEVLMARNRIGPFGASAIFLACSNSNCIQRLNLRRCRIGERGALVFAQWVVPSAITALREVDLSANYIGFGGCRAIELALLERIQVSGDKVQIITVDLEGNHVLQEVMNAVTHGLGILLAAIGTCLMTRRVQSHHNHGHILSCAVYSMSLIVLYSSSTLYHSFFSLQNTRYIFFVFDKCAIYVLIAGSYTPFLQIVLGHKPTWSFGLLSLIWSCCVLGISVEAFCPTWQWRGRFSLAMYLGMGWLALVCMPEISTLVPESCVHFMVLGGVAYTSGVPFFVRNNNLDHAIWHLFVLVGSIFHWCGIYFYVIDYVPNNTCLAEQLKINHHHPGNVSLFVS